MERFVGLIGIVVIFLIVFGMSNKPKGYKLQNSCNWIYITNSACCIYI